MQPELELGALGSWHSAPSSAHDPMASGGGGVPLLWDQLWGVQGLLGQR